MKYLLFVFLLVSLVYSEKTYSWGLNSNGQLGLGDLSNKDKPSLINSDNMKYVYSGYTFSFYITNDDKFYGFGSNGNYELGMENQTEYHIPTENKLLSNLNITSISSGKSHVLVMTNNSLIYGFGYNLNGELGLSNNTMFIKTPVLIDFFKNKNVTFICSGFSHNLILVESSELYSYGLNTYGQLGHGDTISRNTPTRINFFNTKNITIVDCGGDSAFVYTSDDKKLWVFGYNGGKFGLGDNGHRYSPVENTFFTSKPISKISMGNIYSMVLTKTNILYSFGKNGFGQLGLGDVVNRVSPVQVSFFNDKTIIEIYSNYDFSYVMVTDQVNQKLYGFGYNTNGALGLGDTANKQTPTEITGFTKNFLINNKLHLSNAQHTLYSPDYHCYSKKSSNPSVCSGNGQCSDLNLCICNKGYYYSSENCVPCAKNTYSNVTGAISSSTCKSCPTNSYSALSECVFCQPGTYLYNSTCFNCPKGTYQPNDGKDNELYAIGKESCLFCPVGYYNDENGKGICKSCISNCYTGATTNNETRLANDTQLDIYDPLLQLFEKMDINTIVFRYVKFAFLALLVLPLLCVIAFLWLFSHLIFKKPKFDYLFSKQHYIKDNTTVNKKKTKFGEICTGIVIITVFIIGFAVLIDFFVDNRVVKNNFAFVANRDIRADLQINLTVSNGIEFCSKTTFDVKNIISFGKLYKTQNENDGHCNIQIYCTNCSLLNTFQDVYIHFTSDTSYASTNSFSYNFSLNSVIYETPFLVKGVVIPSSGKMIHGKDPTILSLSIVRTKYTKLFASFMSGLWHAIDILYKMPDLIYYGYIISHETTTIKESDALISGSGFIIHFALKKNDNTYITQEENKLTFSNLIAILVSLTSAVVILNTFGFKIISYLKTVISDFIENKKKKKQENEIKTAISDLELVDANTEKE